MKFLSRICTLMILAALNLPCAAQNQADIKLIYEVQQTQSFGNNKTVILPYSGYIYYSPKQQKIISFLKPEYLSEYPDGQKTVEMSPGVYNSMEVITDSMQYISLVDMGQKKYWYGFNQTRNSWKFIQRSLTGQPPRWKITEETKKINGLLCKKALVYVSNQKSPVWEVWFCTEHIIPWGFLMLENIPGFIVEAENYTSWFKFRLKEIKTGPYANAGGKDVFWPKIFQTAKFE